FFFLSVFKEVDLNSKTNRTEHHTSTILADELIVRRGQAFTVTLKLTQAFNPDLYPLTVVAMTGDYPSEKRGTKSCFGIPDSVTRSPSAKAVWKIELEKNSSPTTGILTLIITPPAITPIGQYTLTVKYRDQETLLATVVVLFNPWCTGKSSVYLLYKERQEYVMNEQGIIYRGSKDYIDSQNWDFGQFEDNMVNICMKILDVNNKHKKNPADDESARCNPIYVGRVVSAMINSQDDRGVLEGNWGSSFWGGVSPSQWNGSHAILKKWYNTFCSPVKYGQCWVFAGVMCSVMRLLGIPCRVVTNFNSAHDTDKNLIIDKYHSDTGVMPKESNDSVWNFHVWVEGWMKRPDLAEDGKYDGWQVLDPTPQEISDRVYCCGPASVNAILNGETALKYDVPFVYAEVNADCVDWLIKADGSKVKISSNTSSVGQNISTKSVGSNKRMNITDTYKYPEDKMSRSLQMDTTHFKQSVHVSSLFSQVSKPMNGEDVSLKLVLHSEKNTMFESFSLLLALAELSIPVLVPFSAYHEGMVQNDSMRVSAMVTDKDNDNNPYLTATNVVLINPQLTLTVSGEVRLNLQATVEVVFMNPINKTLKNCSVTISGSGLTEDMEEKLQDLPPNKRLRVQIPIVPYKTGKKTLIANFDCSIFRYIKTSCTVNVKP
uniref:Protein-glutamine gamma-glutamyltransferase 2 n=1 Tax=Anabas testudineus TaxID=64144 RepID=A0A7N6FHS6_ANATE